jgi:hypothetical protein
MNAHTIFYYPYCSFKDEQEPLLKAAALYFDKLYILDPKRAASGSTGSPEVEKDVELLEEAGILERVAPEEVLQEYEDPITATVRAHIEDEEFLQLCEQSGRLPLWSLALAKIPAAIRDDAGYKPHDQRMWRLMRELPKELAPGLAHRHEAYAKALEDLQPGGQSTFVEFPDEEVEYRFADYPLPLAEAIMVNHALFGGLLYKGATPLTDDPFHSQVLDLKIRRTREIPEVWRVLEDKVRQRRLRADLVAATALTDSQLNLPALSPQVPLEAILEYRNAHADELQQARDRLGWLARRIREEPWSDDFEDELEFNTIPNIADELQSLRRVQESWLNSPQGRRVLAGTALTTGTAATILQLVTASTPLLPVQIATAASTLISGVVIPAIKAWLEASSDMPENGLHYLLKIPN